MFSSEAVSEDAIASSLGLGRATFIRARIQRKVNILMTSYSNYILTSYSVQLI